MKKTIFASLVILISLVAYNTNAYAQKTDKKADSKVLTITDNDFDKTIKKGITLVDFWAVWCGPCKMIAPFVAELAGEYEGKAKIGKVDVDNNPNISTTYGIRSIPTILIFRDGKIVDQIIGAVPKQALAQKLDAQLQPA